MAVKNSEALEVFLKVAADSRVSWQVVELAGRGISADAAGVLWVLSVGKSETEGEELADLLMEQGELVDTLGEAWRGFDSGSIPEEDFELRLRSVVTNFEEWVARRRGRGE
jgi:hypothetical protein